jgi:hypothetical protein
MNNKNIQNIKPLIFSKKINNKYKIIPLNSIINTSGFAKHILPATKEWFNSIYAFNSNSIKNFSIIDRNLIKLIRSYFNFYLSNKVLKSKRLATRFRRIAVNKIFISNAELKHTSSKVIITLYVYNEERRILLRKIKRLEAILFPFSKVSLKETRFENKILSMKEKLDILKNQENNIFFNNLSSGLKSYLMEQIKLEEDYLLMNNNNNKLIEEKKLIIRNLNKDLIELTDGINKFKDDSSSNNSFYKLYLDKEINIIAYYKLLLNLNKSKFESKFLSKLKPLISRLYSKEIEFNIVNLKTPYLSSDIFTEVVSLKLKNRDNKLLRILKSSLHMIKLSKTNKIREEYNKISLKELWINKVNNLNINNSYYFDNNDIIHKLLLDLFRDSNKENNNSENKNNLLLNLVLNSLKYKNITGTRLEAKGRLTRRFTASRSVFKIKWKGSLKNIDSSYKGLSSIILRGHAKPNVQYSLVNSKTRNGAFGLKGWISSK